MAAWAFHDAYARVSVGERAALRATADAERMQLDAARLAVVAAVRLVDPREPAAASRAPAPAFPVDVSHLAARHSAIVDPLRLGPPEAGSVRCEPLVAKDHVAARADRAIRRLA